MDAQSTVLALIKGGETDKEVALHCVALAEAQVLGRLQSYNESVAEIPAALSYIVVDVALARYNRIGAEGMTQESVDGYSASYEDVLEKYDATLRKYANAKEGKGYLGEVKFL